MKKSNDTIGNRTRDLPAFSAVPQSTALPRALSPHSTEIKIRGAMPTIHMISRCAQEKLQIHFTSLHLTSRRSLPTTAGPTQTSEQRVFRYIA